MSPTLSYCSFCNKSDAEVRHIIAGPSVYICDECILLCKEIIQEQLPDADTGKPLEHLTPHSIKNALDEHVIGQEHAKKVLAVAVHNHYKRVNGPAEGVELAKSNILLIGPTGSGKTLLAQTLARLLDVPFAIADATSLTQAGYVGDDVESILQRLLSQCDNNVEKAQKGIVYIDEIDKIASRADSGAYNGRDVGGEGVQQALLKMLEGYVCSLNPPGARRMGQSSEKIQINTKDILFICGGAFAGLDRVIANRTRKSSIGFTNSVQSAPSKAELDKLRNELETEDLNKFGLIPEFVGRLSVVATLDELTEDALIEVLTKPKNAITRQYQKLLELEDVELEFTPEAVRAIAKRALDRNTGARGLRTIVENILLDTMFELPSRDDVAKVIVDEAVVIRGEPPQVVPVRKVAVAGAAG